MQQLSDSSTLALQRPRATPIAGAARRDFRWQYLHVIGPRATANAVIHETDIFGRGDAPYVSVGHDAHGSAVHARMRRTKLSYGERSASLGPTGGVHDGRAGYLIDVRAGTSQLSGAVGHARAQAFSGFRTVLLELDGRRSYWEVLHVGTPFVGCVTSAGRRTELGGHFYMDRQWGDLPVQDVVSDWIWGHLVAPHFELVFFHVLTQRGQSVERTLLGDGATFSAGAALESSYLDELRRAAQLSRVSRSFELGVGGVATSVELKPERLLRLRENEVHPGFQAGYARWRVDQAREGLSGVAEDLRIRPG